MSKDRTRSAIDEIYAISERLEQFEKYIVLIDNNIKLLNNKVSKLSKQLVEGEAPKAIAPKDSAGPGGSKPFAVAPKATAPRATYDDDAIPARSKKLVIGDIKLFGYIYSKNESPIRGVNITVFNGNGEVIKEKVTNDEGFWSVRLPPGKYGVEYRHQFGKKRFKPINRTVELTDKMKEFEVT